MAKRNGRMIISIVGLAIVVIGCVMAIAKTYFILPTEVAHQATAFAEMKDEVKIIDVRVDKVEDAVLVIETKFTTIETNMKEQKVLTEKIWEKIK